MRSFILASLTATSLLLVPSASRAAGASVSLTPVCVTKSGAVLFFMEDVGKCEGADRQCRRNRWAYAALKPGAVEFEAAGEATLDVDGSPESNARTAQQTFRSPAAHPCVSVFRAPRLPSPDLAYAEAWFEYSMTQGSLSLHWQGQELGVEGAESWRVSWGKAPQAEALKAAKKADPKGAKATEKVATRVPTLELLVGTDAVLGFPSPEGYLLFRVSQAKLGQLKARLLHQDARQLLEKAAGDLLTAEKAAGVLDAALQLDPSNTQARLDYARLLAMNGDPIPVVRELEQLRSMPSLKKVLEGDKGLDAVREKEKFKKFVQGLP